jgi:hypothetical protein
MCCIKNIQMGDVCRCRWIQAENQITKKQNLHFIAHIPIIVATPFSVKRDGNKRGLVEVYLNAYIRKNTPIRNKTGWMTKMMLEGGGDCMCVCLSRGRCHE